MNNDSTSIQDRSELFAIRAIKAYTELNKRHFDDAGKVLAKNFSERVLPLVLTLHKGLARM